MKNIDIPIIMYHTINEFPEKNPLGCLSFYPEEFEAHLKMLTNLGYEMISMSDLLAYGTVSEKKIAILTFDDGFVDNLLVAKEIMQKYNARGTIFVNPAYAPHGKVRTLAEVENAWGYMTFAEMREVEASKVFDIQAHSMTHEFIFSSDKIIDFYTEDKFDKYYWIAWMLFPESAVQWGADAYKYAKMIPEGYPIFEYDRRLSCKKFAPNDGFVTYVIEAYKKNKTKEDIIAMVNEYADKGEFETHKQYIKEVNYQVVECKSILEKELDKEIDVICYPGGGYNDEVLQICKEAGYKCYMKASRLRGGNNLKQIEIIKKGDFVGLNRISFTHNYPKIISRKCSAYWVGKITMKSFENKGIYSIIKKILRKIR